MLVIQVLLTIGALALPAASQSTSDYVFPAHCGSDPCHNITPTANTSVYVCGDPNLGPVTLPTNFPLGTELATYERFGALCPAQFLFKWTGRITPDAEYQYPVTGYNGSAIDVDKKPIRGNYTLPVGLKLDRFGSESGNFLSPLGAPFIERSLPPRSLNLHDGKYPANYYVYQVNTSFVVALSPVTPWFEQPGLGSQFMTYSKVSELLRDKFLIRLSLEEYDEPAEFADDYTPGYPFNQTA